MFTRYTSGDISYLTDAALEHLISELGRNRSQQELTASPRYQACLEEQRIRQGLGVEKTESGLHYPV